MLRLNGNLRVSTISFNELLPLLLVYALMRMVFDTTGVFLGKTDFFVIFNSGRIK